MTILFAFSILAGFTNYMEVFEIEKELASGVYVYLASILSLGATIGNVSLPTLSDKVGKRKIFLILCSISAICLMVLLQLVQFEYQQL